MSNPESKLDLYQYYLRELNYLKEEGARFAKRYPNEAKFLNVEATELLDPHVERLIETFCFMTAKVQRNIDMEYPSLISYLANFLYPNISAPIPSSSILQVEPDVARGIAAKGSIIPAKTKIQTGSGLSAFELQTVYPIKLWPIKITAIKDHIANTYPGLEQFGNVRTLSVDISAIGVPLQALEIDQLRFYINFDEVNSSTVYERLFAGLEKIVLTQPNKTLAVLPTNSIKAVGFELDELMLSIPAASQNALSLIYDYCYFDRKFMFFDLTLPKISTEGSDLTIHFIFSNNEELPELNQDSLLLNCTPVINITTLYSIPFAPQENLRTYRIIPDTNKPELMEIHSIENVYLNIPGRTTHELPSIFDYNENQNGESCSWFFERSDLSEQSKQQSTIYLSLLNKSHNYYNNASTTVYAKINCACNDVHQLRENTKSLHFSEAYPVNQLRLVSPMTKFHKPLFGSELVWCLYSYLRFNQISFCENDSGMVIRDLFRAVNRYTDNVLEHNIRSLKNIHTAASATFLKTGFYLATVRGYDINMEFNTDDFSGGNPYLLSSVIENYLSNLVAINSFTRVSLYYSNRNLKVKQWPARIGKTSLI